VTRPRLIVGLLAAALFLLLLGPWRAFAQSRGWRTGRGAAVWFQRIACAALGVWSARLRRFETFAWALVYAYVPTLISVLREVHDETLSLGLVVLSSGSVLALLLWARARFREAA